MSGATRGTLARLRRQIAAHRASQPPVLRIVEWEEGESDEELRAKRLDAERWAEAIRAKGWKAAVIIVDREPEEPRP